MLRLSTMTSRGWLVNTELKKDIDRKVQKTVEDKHFEEKHGSHHVELIKQKNQKMGMKIPRMFPRVGTDVFFVPFDTSSFTRAKPFTPKNSPALSSVNKDSYLSTGYGPSKKGELTEKMCRTCNIEEVDNEQEGVADDEKEMCKFCRRDLSTFDLENSTILSSRSCFPGESPQYRESFGFTDEELVDVPLDLFEC